MVNAQWFAAAGCVLTICTLIVIDSKLAVPLRVRCVLACFWAVPFGLGTWRGVAEGDLPLFSVIMGVMYASILVASMGRPLNMMGEFLPPLTRYDPVLQRRRTVGMIFAVSVSISAALAITWISLN